MTWKPHVTVAAIVEQDQRFLFVEEISEGLNVINQPAGHLEPGESLLEAVIRETLEETAWQFTPEAITGIYQWTSPGNTTFLRVCYCGIVDQHDAAQALDEGILRTLWLDREELKHAALRSPLVSRAVDDYLAGIRHPLDLLTHIG